MGMEHARSTAWNSQVESHDQSIESEDGKAKVPWEIKLFKGWLSTVHLPVDFENYSASDLNDVLSQFYVDGKNRRGEPYSVGTLFDVRKGIMGYLCGISRQWEENVNSVYFHTSNSLLEAMQENLRESSVRPKTSMKIPMTTDDINQLMESGVLTNDNPLGLFRKVWFDLTLHLGCGGQAALRGLTKDSFVMETDERGRRYIRLNHSVQGQRDRSCMEMQYWNWDGRMYELPGDPNCPVHSMELYLAKRNPHKDAFFQRPKTHYNQSGGLWYESPVGHGVLASLMSKMSEDSCLSRAYTNSSVRVTLADILEDKGLNVENILGINPKNKSVKSMMNRSSNHSSDELERNSKLIHEALYGPVTC